jgi:hypothetical protein
MTITSILLRFLHPQEVIIFNNRSLIIRDINIRIKIPAVLLNKFVKLR